jgi:hypothetical protein
LIRTALAQNYDLREAIARVDAARVNLGITEAEHRRLEHRSTELLQKRNILRQVEITEEIEVIILSVEALE